MSQLPQITLDPDGYPTDEYLDAITCYTPDGGWTTAAFHEFMECIRQAWQYAEWGVWRERDVWHFSTGGWSGNESIIAALRENVLFWGFYAAAWYRGGHYVFAPDTVNV